MNDDPAQPTLTATAEGKPVASEFRKELESAINRSSMENGSDTPDFILAEYLADCLAAFDKATKRRSEWYGPSVPGH